MTPYAELNWESIGHYDAMFHIHPGMGAEQYNPHQTIDRYHEEGFRIIAFSPHDYDIPDDYIDSVYPWTRLSEIYETIKDVENPTEGNRTYKEFAKEPFQNRDPVALGMVSIEGSELSGHHHLVSLFNSFTESTRDISHSFQTIEELGGVAYFAHPGRYAERQGLTADFYIDLYRKHAAAVGQVVYNRRDNHPQDRAFFDRVAHALGAERPIWMFSEDDMHREETVAWNRNVMLIEDFQPGSLHPDIQDGSAPAVREALKRGDWYIWKPSEQYGRRQFNIVDVTVSRGAIRLRVDHEERVREVRWRTHNPGIDDTETIHYGYSISVVDVPVYSRLVRAEIEGQGGTIYTQPIYLTSR